MEVFPIDGVVSSSLALALFKNVKNASELKAKYLDKVALLDAGLVISVFQLRAAAAMAMDKQQAGKMKTRSLPSEIVWSLSGSKNMTASLQTFCVQEVADADLLVAAIGIGEEDLRLILANVEGQICNLDEVGRGLEESDARNRREKVKKVYKIFDEELAMSSLEECVVMRMAVKDH